MISVPLPEQISNCPLVIIDVVKGCCNKEYEIPEWDIYYQKIRKMLPHLNNFIKKLPLAFGEYLNARLAGKLRK